MIDGGGPEALLTLMVLAAACRGPDASEHARAGQAPTAFASGEVRIAPRTTALPNYPCSRCHAERATDPHERPLRELHGRMQLTHGKIAGWCYGCHAQTEIDRLRLPDGRTISFDDSFELCGSCHGEKLRDWRADIHGLTTGYWNGPRERRTCTACHDPHAPQFPAMPSRPAPPRPKRSVARQVHSP